MGNVFAHTLRLPMAFFEKRHLGDVVSRMGAVQAIQRTLTTSFIEALVDGLMAVATLAMMLAYSPKLAAVTGAAVLVYLGLRALAFRPLRAATERQLAASAQQQSHLLETLRGIQSIKLAGQEPQRQAQHQNLMVATINQELALARLGLGFGTASVVEYVNFQNTPETDPARADQITRNVAFGAVGLAGGAAVVVGAAIPTKVWRR